MGRVERWVCVWGVCVGGREERRERGESKTHSMHFLQKNLFFSKNLHFKNLIGDFEFYSPTFACE